MTGPTSTTTSKAAAQDASKAAAQDTTAKTRQEAVSPLRSQDQEQARQRFAASTASGEQAVVLLIDGIAAVVRSVVPPLLLHPEDVIQTSFLLADQSLRVARQVALSATENLRALAA